MPHDDAPPKRPSAERAKMWKAWLDGVLEERRLRPADLLELLNRRGFATNYKSGTIGNWRTATYAPSELAAWDVADALNLPAPDVLRAAGFDEMARKVELVAAHGTQPAAKDPVLELLDAVGDPELTAPIAREYERDMFVAQRRVELELAELRRRLAARNGANDADSAAH